MANSFLELNWLAKSDKYILLPIVLFIKIDDAGGWIIHPKKKECLIGEKYYPLDRGIIAINEDRDSSFPVDSVLAHEWRHLWQLYNFGKPKFFSTWDTQSELSYKQQIIKYFRSNIREYDALLFGQEKAPCDYAEQWYEWVTQK